MIPGAVEMTTVSNLDRIKLALIGEPKSGKSWLTTTAPKPVFIWDFDDRKESIAGKQEVFAKTLVDASAGNPNAFAEFSADIGKFEYMKSQGQPIPATFVIDSMSNLARFAMFQGMKDDPSQVKEVTVSGVKVKIARGYNAYQNEDQVISNSIIRLFALGHVIAVFHERPEEAADSTEENPKFTGKLSVHPPRYRNYLPLFNEQWRMIAGPNKSFQVQTATDYRFTGATTFANLQQTEVADIMALIEKAKQVPKQGK